MCCVSVCCVVFAVALLVVCSVECALSVALLLPSEHQWRRGMAWHDMTWRRVARLACEAQWERSHGTPRGRPDETNGGLTARHPRPAPTRGACAFAGCGRADFLHFAKCASKIGQRKVASQHSIFSNQVFSPPQNNHKVGGFCCTPGDSYRTFRCTTYGREELVPGTA